MWVEERLQQIVALLNVRGRVDIDSLAQRLDVSRETIRRDLLRLEADKILRRIHGGAIAIRQQAESPFQTRAASYVTEKEQIAQIATKLIKEGDSCFIDAGTTTTIFTNALINIPNLLVVTNSLEIANIFHRQRRGAEVLLLGGEVGSDVPATFGTITLEQIGRFHLDHAITSPVGVHPQIGVSYYALAEGDVARAMANAAKQRIVLAHTAKLGVVSRTVALLPDTIDVLVTNNKPDDGFVADIQRLKPMPFSILVA